MLILVLHKVFNMAHFVVYNYKIFLVNLCAHFDPICSDDSITKYIIVFPYTCDSASYT